jgi:hypothetical protein
VKACRRRILDRRNTGGEDRKGQDGKKIQKRDLTGGMKEVGKKRR